MNLTPELWLLLISQLLGMGIMIGVHRQLINQYGKLIDQHSETLIELAKEKMAVSDYRREIEERDRHLAREFERVDRDGRRIEASVEKCSHAIRGLEMRSRIAQQGGA